MNKKKKQTWVQSWLDKRNTLEVTSLLLKELVKGIIILALKNILAIHI